MSRIKILKKPYRSILYWTVYTLIIITLIAFTVGEVYAKYVTASRSDNPANVAGVGIEVFELVEHGNLKLTDHGGTEPGITYDCKKVIPGVDIPGPHVKLKIDSAVSYTLYVKVTVPKVDCIKFGDAEAEETNPTITYKMSANWVEHEKLEKDDCTVYTYKYNVAETPAQADYVFKAGVKYVHDSPDTEIQILDGDKIDVSQYFDYNDFVQENSSNVSDFTLSFEAYIRQVIS